MKFITMILAVALTATITPALAVELTVVQIFDENNPLASGFLVNDIPEVWVNTNGLTFALSYGIVEATFTSEGLSWTLDREPVPSGAIEILITGDPELEPENFVATLRVVVFLGGEASFKEDIDFLPSEDTTIQFLSGVPIEPTQGGAADQMLFELDHVNAITGCTACADACCCTAEGPSARCRHSDGPNGTAESQCTDGTTTETCVAPNANNCWCGPI